ncbi:MAG TPA: CoA transferase [Dehalococcoidia bacterium]|nr:CoA transferase [Dehalococcoidia bacterium]
MSPILDGVRVLEAGGRAAAVCGLLFAQLGADVVVVPTPPARREPGDPAEAGALSANKRVLGVDTSAEERAGALARLLESADLAVFDMPPSMLESLGLAPAWLASQYPRLVVAAITPFGLEGPKRDYRGGDLISFHASGIARLLVGHVEDPEAEPPVRAAGEQAAFIAGLTAACAAMHALYHRRRGGAPELIDVSWQEALALMAPRELAMPAFGGQPAPREGRVRGGSAVIPVLPTRDGYVAVSPREPHQWRNWLKVLGEPEWGAEPRFATRALRTSNYEDLFEHMASWTRERTSNEIFEACQAAHVPCFPFGTPALMLDEPQLQHRRFFTPLLGGDGPAVVVPRPPFGLPPDDYAAEARAAGAGSDWLPREEPPGISPGPRQAPPLPLSGIRVVDFSWVIAGPTCTRYLALMGAEVIKVESPQRPDTGRASELHDVLGQSKLGLSLDLKAPGALDAVRRLLRDTDVVVENFATGVMDRLGLGYDSLRALNPDIILLSASGLGRTGPGAEWVAYGNLLSAYSGFATLNGFPGREPRTGLAWADPLCGLLMAFGVVAALHNRDRGGGGRHIDFSMLEGLLWTMPGPLIRAQLGVPEAAPAGNDHAFLSPHGVYRCRGEDSWLAVAVEDERQWQALCGLVPSLAGMWRLSEAERRMARAEIDARIAAWARDQEAIAVMETLQAAGVPASASLTTNDLFGDSHLWDRGFYKPVPSRDGAPHFLPGLPWRWGNGALIEPRQAPGLGEHNFYVLRNLGGLSEEDYQALVAAGAFGKAG